MFACPQGHQGSEQDYCVVCGVSMDPPEPEPPDAGPEPPGAVPDADAGWLVEVSVDPQWHAARPAAGRPPCPPPGVPVRVDLTGPAALIGRTSERLGAVPDVDCSADPGVSHHQARLVRAAQGWTVQDLGSTNGTHLDGRQLEPHQPTALAAGQPLLMGWWTRLTLVGDLRRDFGKMDA